MNGTKIVLINYADDKFRSVQKLCSYTGKIIGRCSQVISYTPEDIDKQFANKNKQILETKRGAGLWLWKPYFIHRTMKQLNKGDYLFYCDSGAFFVRSIKEIIKSMDQDIWVTELPLIEEQWTKPECFSKMGLDTDKYKKSNQIQASFLCIRKTDDSEIFVKKWLALCCDFFLISPKINENDDSEKPVFIAHREDQSLLSLLCKKEGIIPHKDPSQFGRYPEGYKQIKYVFRTIEHKKDKYKPTIILHRQSNIKWKLFIKSYLIAFGPKIVADYLFWRHRDDNC